MLTLAPKKPATFSSPLAPVFQKPPIALIPSVTTPLMVSQTPLTLSEIASQILSQILLMPFMASSMASFMSSNLSLTNFQTEPRVLLMILSILSQTFEVERETVFHTRLTVLAILLKIREIGLYSAWTALITTLAKEFHTLEVVRLIVRQAV